MTTTVDLTFKDLNLPQPILQALEKVGYEKPSPIQAESIPLLMQGHDLLGQAQTGTGKTAAFALPMLANIDPDAKLPQLLVLAPTRELAIQVAEAFQVYASFSQKIKVLPVYGGQSYDNQIRQLKRGVQVVVGTPGRIIDHINRKTLNLSELRFLVLDEADEMLRMGFIDDVEWILEQLPEERQMILFSATMPSSIVELSRDMLYDPVRVEVSPESSTVEAIEQSLMFVMKKDKRDLLTHLIRDENPEKVLVFSRTKHGCNRIVKQLAQDEIEALAIHGNKSQGAREKALGRFREGSLQVLVATDVASRGIDVSDISHVINLDLPNESEVYVHRIGRTGRAGQGGIAIAFCDENEGEYLRGIEKTIRQEIPVDEDHPFHSEKAKSRKGEKAPKKQQRGRRGGGGRQNRGGQNRRQNRGQGRRRNRR